ncbi:hypothetical protein [Rhodoflexus caldus]|uniref:hypothetical protein n=1 Tax=Rhodoflexus caldus TaxID=2891236 RepID=UPI00202A373B|nr:hypothetical protein [Rhodoflexus caldus]
MKKTLTLFALLIIGLNAFACEICGCGVGNFYMGITPQFNRHFIGVRYRQIAYDSHLGIGGTKSHLTTHELFQTVELWARFYPTQRIQVMAFLPYHVNRQTDYNQTFSKTLSGLGEGTLLANYRLLDNTHDTLPRHFRHNLLIGGGVKLPTARFRFDVSDNQQVANPNFQLGSGSTDFLANLVYVVRAGKWGLSTDLNLKINTTNADGYRFGNRISGQAALFHARNVRGVSVMPYVGAFGEYNLQDNNNGVVISNTGGRAAFAVGGLELYIGRVSIGGNFQQPLRQDFANGTIKTYGRAVAHLTIMI